jgi:hypothetical protein
VSRSRAWLRASVSFYIKRRSSSTGPLFYVSFACLMQTPASPHGRADRRGQLRGVMQLFYSWATTLIVLCRLFASPHGRADRRGQLCGVMQLCYSWLAKGRSSIFDDPAFFASEFQHINTRNPARKAVIEQEPRAFVFDAARQVGFASSSAQGRPCRARARAKGVRGGSCTTRWLYIVECARKAPVIQQEPRVFVVEAAQQGCMA